MGIDKITPGAQGNVPPPCKPPSGGKIATGGMDDNNDPKKVGEAKSVESTDATSDVGPRIVNEQSITNAQAVFLTIQQPEGHLDYVLNNEVTISILGILTQPQREAVRQYITDNKERLIADVQATSYGADGGSNKQKNQDERRRELEAILEYLHTLEESDEV